MWYNPCGASYLAQSVRCHVCSIIYVVRAIEVPLPASDAAGPRGRSAPAWVPQFRSRFGTGFPLLGRGCSRGPLRAQMAGYHLSPFEVGQVLAHMEHGLGCTSIAKLVKKADGKTFFEERAISNCMRKLRENPGWRGERESGSGPPRKTSEKQDQAIVKWVLENRGSTKVSVSRLKKQFRFLRGLSATLVEERLAEADLVWLRRRSKALVTRQHLAARVEYCQGVKRKRQATLERWAYVDGTTYYLDKTSSEHEHAVRRSLGSHVWRKSDNSDALYADCVGPSSYNKAQGQPVRVWGMLAAGVLNVHVLDEGEVMDRALYVELIEDKFDDWRLNCDFLVCDYEGCLRTPEALHALNRCGLQLVDGYPKVSQDFNAIENAWAILRERLDETCPVDLETRGDFVKRLRAAVRWANTHRSDQLWMLSTNQKKRATECLASTPPGARTKW